MEDRTRNQYNLIDHGLLRVPSALPRRVSSILDFGSGGGTGAPRSGGSRRLASLGLSHET